MKILSVLLFIIGFPIFYTGLVLYWSTKPMRSLAWLMMFRPWTAWEELTEDWTSQATSLKDL